MNQSTLYPFCKLDANKQYRFQLIMSCPQHTEIIKLPLGKTLRQAKKIMELLQADNYNVFFSLQAVELKYDVSINQINNETPF